MIDFDFHNECTGCRACADVCPKQCIAISEDRDGFVMPSVDKDTCVNCGLCEKACPALNHQVEPYEYRQCYAVYHKDDEIRTEGSSGSVFFALAELIVEKQGGAAYGAAFDNNLQLHHTRVTDMDGVRSQVKSKYIQSDTTGIYRHVLTDLREGRDVLFVGTPCQCQALHNMAPAKYREKLLLADIICHGVPSQSLFNRSIKQYEKKNKCAITSFSFREKTKESLRNYKITYTTPDDNTITRIGDLDEIPFCVGYFNHWIIRNSCYGCKQRGVERVADVTLGDFWGIKEIHHELDDFEKGYSSIIVNTEKGKQIVEQLSSCAVEEIQGGVQFVATHNRAYTKPDNKSLMRKVFFWCLHHCGFEFCERHFLSVQPSLFGRILNSAVIRLDKIQNYSQHG